MREEVLYTAGSRRRVTIKRKQHCSLYPWDTAARNGESQISWSNIFMLPPTKWNKDAFCYRKSRKGREILTLQTLKQSSMQNFGDIKFPRFETASAVRHVMTTASCRGADETQGNCLQQYRAGSRATTALSTAQVDRNGGTETGWPALWPCWSILNGGDSGAQDTYAEFPGAPGSRRKGVMTLSN